jgi:hypothetical protein
VFAETEQWYFDLKLAEIIYDLVRADPDFAGTIHRIAREHDPGGPDELGRDWA